MDMRLVDACSLSPFQCVDGNTGGRIVDTSMATNNRGRVYLSERMVENAVRLIGSFVPADDHDEVVAKLADAEVRLAELEGQVAELVPVRDAIASAAQRWGDVVADDEPVRRSGGRKAA